MWSDPDRYLPEWLYEKGFVRSRLIFPMYGSMKRVCQIQADISLYGSMKRVCQIQADISLNGTMKRAWSEHS